MELIINIIRNSVLITGLVVVMMMMIESLNIESKGRFFHILRKTKIGQVICGATLGAIPGCMGGFATVSLYTHRMFSIGALVAMMIASSGDEAFVMLAMIPDKAFMIFTILFAIAVVVGISTDLIAERIHKKHCPKVNHSDCGAETQCTDGYQIHPERQQKEIGSPKRHFGWKRITMLIGLAIFIAALATGKLGHDHSAHEGHSHTSTEEYHHSHTISCTEHSHSCTDSHAGHTFNLLSEDWMNILFAGLSIIILFVLVLASDHFVEEHLWNHIIKKHLLTIFAWTFGVLLLVGVGLQYMDIEKWISNNTVMMIILATLIGIIPESGPHMIFVTLYATGIIPLPVLLASSISQDGHASLPLLAESRKSFIIAKAINCLVALIVGFGSLLIL